jgi:ribosome recycling factor
MIDVIFNEAKTRMDKTISSLESDLSKIRSNRAHPSLLEHLTVDYYGNQTPLQQVASINAEDARTLVVAPWEKQMVSVIEKAIMNSGLGLNPASAGMVIRVPMPALTEERRRDLTKVVRDEVERARVAVRNIRRELNTDLKELQKSKEISEDDEKRAQTKSQKLTDDFIAKIDAICEKKESELMTI